MSKKVLQSPPKERSRYVTLSDLVLIYDSENNIPVDIEREIPHLLNKINEVLSKHLVAELPQLSIKDPKKINFKSEPILDSPEEE